MQYDELHQRYGTHIAKRIETELHSSEFSQVGLTELTDYLELRAEAAHKEYQIRLDDPFSKEQMANGSTSVINMLYRRWRAAEELSYLLAIAEDVNMNARLSVAG